MSWNRENVMWESPDGTWNRGYWAVDYIDPDGDPEWDVTYSDSRFEEWRFGLRSGEAANNIDPRQGGHYVPSTPDNADYIARLEAIKAAHRARR